MSKVTFRSRQVDGNKLLPIYKWKFREAPDPLDYVPITKIVTGMEKEEETEYHLQNVLTTDSNGNVGHNSSNHHHNNNNKKQQHIAIPTPKIIDSPFFHTFYNTSFNQSKHLISAPAFSFLDDDPVDYNLDSEDEREFDFSQGQATKATQSPSFTPERFEYVMDKFEKGCGGKQALTLKEAKAYLRSFYESYPADFYTIYDYWLSKRMKEPKGMLFSLKEERFDVINGKNNGDPYIAFRRRTEKMQTRKHRKADEQTYIKMFSLKRNLFSLKKISEYIKLRECFKESIAIKDAKIAALTIENNIITGDITIESKENDPEHLIRKVKSNLKSRKRKNSDSVNKCFDESFASSGSSENEFEFVRYNSVKFERPSLEDPLCEQRRKKSMEGDHDLSIYHHHHNQRHNMEKYSLFRLSNTDSHSFKQVDYMKPRIGRNNRFVFDRAQHTLPPVRDFLQCTNDYPSSFKRLDKLAKSTWFTNRMTDPLNDINCFSLPENPFMKFSAFSSISSFTMQQVGSRPVNIVATAMSDKSTTKTSPIVSKVKEEEEEIKKELEETLNNNNNNNSLSISQVTKVVAPVVSDEMSSSSVSNSNNNSSDSSKDQNTKATGKQKRFIINCNDSGSGSHPETPDEITKATDVVKCCEWSSLNDAKCQTRSDAL